MTDSWWRRTRGRNQSSATRCCASRGSRWCGWMRGADELAQAGEALTGAPGRACRQLAPCRGLADVVRLMPAAGHDCLLPGWRRQELPHWRMRCCCPATATACSRAYQQGNRTGPTWSGLGRCRAAMAGAWAGQIGRAGPAAGAGAALAHVEGGMAVLQLDDLGPELDRTTSGRTGRWRKRGASHRHRYRAARSAMQDMTVSRFHGNRGMSRSPTRLSGGAQVGCYTADPLLMCRGALQAAPRDSWRR